MSYLLDTHVVLWMLDEVDKLPDKVKNILVNPENKCYFSTISLFEIAIKKNIGKLTIEKSISQIKAALLNQNFTLLLIKESHLDELAQLRIAENHRDPFDRLLISTAIVEGISLISVDGKFEQYNDLIDLVWE